MPIAKIIHVAELAMYLDICCISLYTLEKVITYFFIKKKDRKEHQKKIKKSEKNPKNFQKKMNHEIAGITNSEITKCGDPL